ncbi:TetR/AcrR family transcriptional regulator [Streptomyces albipurpureus]|uniref:TetR/AcrR family transcriptional regulator n=1 Tax=Streptomyces albipurpureus TaxID=2897419 RepID=A0ABT0UU54_9ACTN|nr:TetR/AcrR family transcriptional regulator [Streptomyces sp. CWNU-1]MCM2391150.1 TetR/AcrR family transcriptional regulator [Streptomyces sp. CWNU-1]
MTSTAGSPQAPRPPRPARRRRPGTYAAADARREQVLEAAGACFAQSGYLNSSLARIAADAGTSATVVLHHFGSKERLLMAVLERHEERSKERVAKLLGPAGPNSLQVVRDSMLEVTAYNVANPGRLQLFVRLSAEAGDPDHPAHSYFVQRYQEIAGVLEAALRAAVATGEIRADTDVRQVAQEVMAVSDGLQVQWALAEGHFDLRGALAGYYDRLTRAVSAGGRDGVVGPG